MSTSSAPRPSLDSLIFDILIIIFGGLDARDVVRAGMTCRTLYALTKERRIWWDQTQNWFKRNPALKLVSSQLESSPVDDLRDFAVRQSRLRLRWSQGDESVERYTPCEGLPRYSRAWLMPGGNIILFASFEGGGRVALHRISPGTHPSIEPVPFVSYAMEPSQSAMLCWMGLLRATSPYPIFACAMGPSLHLLSVDYVHGRISPEQVVPLATQSSNLVIRGQDRVLVYIPVHPLAPVTGKTMVAIHLDYPGTTLEILLPLAQDGGLPVYNICLPNPGVVFARRHLTDSLLLYELPDFSTLRRGANTLRETPRIISLQPPGSQYLLERAYLGVHIYDRSLNPSFHLSISRKSDGGVASKLLTWRVDPSAAEHPVTEESQVALPELPRHAETEEGSIFFWPRMRDRWVYLVVPVGELGWNDRTNVLKLSLPTGMSIGPAFKPSFDLASGRVLFMAPGGSVTIAEII